MHNGVLRLKVYVDLEIYAEGGFESLWAWVLASGTLEESQFSRPSVVRPRPKSITSSHHDTSLSICLRIGRLIALRPREIPITITTNKRLSHKIV